MCPCPRRWGVAGDELHSFFISVLDGGKWSNSRLISFNAENESRYPLTKRVGFKSRLHAFEKGKNPLPLPRFEPQIIHPVA